MVLQQDDSVNIVQGESKKRAKVQPVKSVAKKSSTRTPNKSKQFKEDPAQDMREQQRLQSVDRKA